MAAISEKTHETLISPETLKKFDIPGPRYTSYPTADRFSETFSADALIDVLKQRRDSLRSPLSLYVHIPFCESLCFYCACNKIITRRHERGTEYLRYLAKETTLYIAEMGRGQAVTQLHLGGGSPTFFSDEELSDLMSMLRGNFYLVPDGEYSIEIDPRTVNAARLQQLALLGFNRLSFGVQDFAPEVQQAVHRIQPASQVFSLMETARTLGFKSINVDLIYGLPKQTPQSFEKTIQTTITLRPDRIALYAYAHLPERFKPQRQIKTEDLPEANAKISMLGTAISMFFKAGYVYVGMDHFALPDDALAIAKREGRLHRNFQGYSTLPNCDLIALGVSAIGRAGSVYSQNAKTLEDYYRQLDTGRLPVTRGLQMNEDNRIRYAVIMSIMCQGRIQFAQIENDFDIDFHTYFADELDAMVPLEKDGLLTLEAGALQVTPLGWYFVRGIAMFFDSYLQPENNKPGFPKLFRKTARIASALMSSANCKAECAF